MKELKREYILKTGKHNYTYNKAILGVVVPIIMVVANLWAVSTKEKFIMFVVVVLSISIFMLWKEVFLPELIGVVKNIKELAKVEKVLDKKGYITVTELSEIAKVTYVFGKLELIEEMVEVRDKNIDSVLERSRKKLTDEELDTAKQTMKRLQESIVELKHLKRYTKDMNPTDRKANEIKNIVRELKVMEDLEYYEKSLLVDPTRIGKEQEYIQDKLPEAIAIMRKYAALDKEKLEEDNMVKKEDVTGVIKAVVGEINIKMKEYRVREVEDLKRQVSSI